jgi:hypothetical protein
VAFHATHDAFVGLLLSLFEKVPVEKHSEEKDQQDNHDRGADEFRQGELPTQQRRHDDAEFEDEIGGSHFECHRSREVRALAEQRAG